MRGEALNSVIPVKTGILIFVGCCVWIPVSRHEDDGSFRDFGYSSLLTPSSSLNPPEVKR